MPRGATVALFAGPSRRPAVVLSAVFDSTQEEPRAVRAARIWRRPHGINDCFPQVSPSP
uniref:Uncharacterized protein n=1 Tax=Zea mays TaxID=4577 RepID=B6U582_MAIZE|nr:hypothetical protein [Zea mays]